MRRWRRFTLLHHHYYYLMITNNLLSPLMCVAYFSHHSTGRFIHSLFLFFSSICAMLQKRDFFISLPFPLRYFLYFILFFFAAALSVSFSLDTCVWMRISTRKCCRTMTVLRVYRFRKSWNQFFKNIFSLSLLAHCFIHSTLSSLAHFMTLCEFPKLVKKYNSIN